MVKLFIKMLEEFVFLMSYSTYKNKINIISILYAKS